MGNQVPLNSELRKSSRAGALTRARPLDLNHNTRFHTHIRLSIYVFDGHILICLLSQGAHPNSHRAIQSSQRLDSLTPASSPVRVTHLCRTASRWLHSQHAVFPLPIYLRRAFIHIYVYPYMYLSDSVYPSLSAQRGKKAKEKGQSSLFALFDDIFSEK